MIKVFYNLQNLIIIIHIIVIQQYIIVNANNSRKLEKVHKISSDNVVSSNQFCNDTIEPKLEPIMCPNLFSSSHHIHGHFCPRLLDLNISLLQSSSYAVTKSYWQTLLHKFKTHVGRHEVFFLGDSIRGQMISQLRCLEDFTAVSIMHHVHDSALTGFPTPLNLSLYNFSKYANKDIVDRAYRQEWYYHIRGNNRIKYLVINTGMWWNPDYFIYLKNNSLVHNTDEMLDIYRDYFHRDGLLLTRLYDLIHNYNITVLWRDTTPAGSCTIPDRYEKYHTSISTMNTIAQSSLSEIGVVIIPGLWDESLPYWKHHIELGSQGYMDLVHYCAFQNQSVMNVWIRKTIHTILSN